ncbi:hypothetical protein QYY62_05445 [Xanthomonas campestris pv. campestris]|uniref:DUF7002 family protein n=1 Tax=Xanthomonas TaxID=338 RepID=UPI0006432BA8|nr:MULTISPECIES: hypothetical protein [Xanthomonas]KOR46400.1 hypothetical protein ADT27_10270 [Xanthomonas oryzae]AKK65932.1 hypothetical protein FE36_20230 [Xanthomonas oryzae pv. oryzicola]AKN99971.1 hypothetical protein ACU15_05040 [Xanthomonas oryzae pv. oryzicola]MEA0619748.1 hypothetical protein [Xanthomonas campestris pv. campestris]MEA0644298.1 hypothetical protein [Xanthomonas campestris pv. campestris]
MLLEKLIERYPYLYHMAEAGTWPSIQQRGLLSTTAALDALGVSGARRQALEGMHRPTMLALKPGAPDDIVLRDQRPMPPSRLAQALPTGLTTEQWYRLINSKVFFWVSEERLGRLLRSYGADEHDVLRVDTASLLSAHFDRTWLCHMNSGNTLPIPHWRDENTFKRIPDYPVNRVGRPVKDVVELVVDYSVPDIATHVVDVTRVKGDTKLGVIWRADHDL